MSLRTIPKAPLSFKDEAGVAYNEGKRYFIDIASLQGEELFSKEAITEKEFSKFVNSHLFSFGGHSAGERLFLPSNFNSFKEYIKNLFFPLETLENSSIEEEEAEEVEKSFSPSVTKIALLSAEILTLPLRILTTPAAYFFQRNEVTPDIHPLYILLNGKCKEKNIPVPSIVMAYILEESVKNTTDENTHRLGLFSASVKIQQTAFPLLIKKNAACPVTLEVFHEENTRFFTGKNFPSGRTIVEEQTGIENTSFTSFQKKHFFYGFPKNPAQEFLS